MHPHFTALAINSGESVAEKLLMTVEGVIDESKSRDLNAITSVDHNDSTDNQTTVPDLEVPEGALDVSK